MTFEIINIIILLMTQINHPTKGEAQFLGIVILIDHEQSFEFMIKYSQQLTIESLMNEFQKTYVPIIKPKILYKDKQCQKNIQLNEYVQNNQRYFLNLTYNQYETIIKSLFIGLRSQKQSLNPENSNQIRTIKTENANISTVEGKSQTHHAQQQVSKFEIKLEEKIYLLQNSQHTLKGAEEMPQLEIFQDPNQTNQVHHPIMPSPQNQPLKNQIEATTNQQMIFSGKTTKVDNIDCCALI